MSYSRDPKHLQTIKELKPGDIILFRSPKPFSLIASLITMGQSLVSQTHGHCDTTHAAICTKIDKGKPYIAHLIGPNVMGYIQESLEDVINRDGGDRAFITYRPNDQIIAAKIAAAATRTEEDKRIQWSISAALGAFIRTAAINANRTISKKEFSQNSFCSKFVIQAMKVATQETKDDKPDVKSKYYPNIRSSSTPKTLEAHLFNNPNYSVLVHPGKDNPYELIKTKIRDEIFRVGCRIDKMSTDKTKILNNYLTGITGLLDAKNGLDDLQKAIILLKEISPALKLNTGFGFRTASTYTSVMATARTMGIFEKTIKDAKFEKPVKKFTSRSYKQ